MEFIDGSYNYGRLTWAPNPVWHIVGPAGQRPRAVALCGVKRVAQRPGERPAWADNRQLPPENVCQECAFQAYSARYAPSTFARALRYRK